jgi:hypothetical protein
MSESHGGKDSKKHIKKIKKMIKVGEYRRLRNEEEEDSIDYLSDNPETSLIPHQTGSENNSSSSSDESDPSSDEDTKQSIKDLKEAIRDREIAERRLHHRLIKEQERVERKVEKSRRNK